MPEPTYYTVAGFVAPAIIDRLGKQVVDIEHIPRIRRKFD